MNEVGKKFIKKPQWNHVGMTYVTVVYADEHGVLIESSPKGRSYWSREGFEREYKEYHEPVVHELTRAVVHDQTTDKVYLWPLPIADHEGISTIGTFKVKVTDGKLSIEVLP